MKVQGSTAARAPTRTGEVAKAQQKSEAKATGYSNANVFEEVKKAVGDYTYEGFSETRLESLKNETLDSMQKWLKAHPDATEDQAVKEMERIYDQMVGQSFIEKSNFDYLWNQLKEQLQRTMDEMKRNLEG